MNSSPRTRSTLRLFGGSSHPELAGLIARKVGVRVGNLELTKFYNKETRVEILENVRSQNIYIIQTGGSGNPNDHLMELMFLINACRLSSANSVTVILPLFPYSKGDQKDGYRVPISSKLVADLLKRAGANHLMVLDPHTPQLEGFFDIPVDALKAESLFINWIRKNICMVVSPDEGGVKRCISLANDLGLDFSLIHNRHKKTMTRSQYSSGAESSISSYSNHSVDDEEDSTAASSINDEEEDSSERRDAYDDVRIPQHSSTISGSVSGRSVLLMDDMIDTGSTILHAIKVLKNEKADKVYIFVTHGIFSGDALEKIMSQDIEAVVVTNSLPQKGHEADKFHTLDVSGLIAEFIRRHHYRESVSVLSNFMPIRDEPNRHFNTRDGRVSVLECDNDSVVTNHQESPLAVQKLRKGFRLSSVCWD